MTHHTDGVPSRTLGRFKRWFWRRPRPHGATIRDRRVSPLESLYDLVYAVVIAQAGPTLGIPPTESLVERIGLFTIIVLGEVVCGVVAGLAAAKHEGATIVTGLVGHAHEARTPLPTAWLLTGAVVVGLLAVIVTAHALEDARRLATAYRPLSAALAAGAVAAAVAGWARPAPWLLAMLLALILTALWAFAVRGFLRAGAWGEGPSSAD